MTRDMTAASTRGCARMHPGDSWHVSTRRDTVQRTKHCLQPAASWPEPSPKKIPSCSHHQTLCLEVSTRAVHSQYARPTKPVSRAAANHHFPAPASRSLAHPTPTLSPCPLQATSMQQSSSRTQETSASRMAITRELRGYTHRPYKRTPLIHYCSPTVQTPG